MKDLRLLLFTTAAVIGMAACNDDERNVSIKDAETVIPVSLEIASASSAIVETRAYTPSYVANGLKVYAYKLDNNGTDYKFSRSITFPDINYNSLTKTWRGDVMLEAGNYKFIPTYGLNSSDNIALSFLDQPLLNENLGFSYITAPSTGNALPEIFLPIRPVEELASFSIDALGKQSQSIKDTIHRAVARVDVMFIKARKEGNIYIEEPYPVGQDIFGQLGLGKMELRFRDIPNRMTLMGQPQNGVINATINAPYLSQNGVTVGTNDQRTSIGDDDYFRFDSVQTIDIINGSAHVFGTYMLPNPINTKTAGLQLYVAPSITNRGGVAKTINIWYDENDNLIPLEQNKVTLIKVYVLRNDHLFGTDPDPIDPDPEDPDPPVPPVPPTPPGPDPDFAIDVQVVVIDDWDESNHVTEPIL